MLFSVIIPVYKVEKYLQQCVDSVLAQTFTDFELILVDDGSPDECPKICDEYARADNRVQVIHKQNDGATSSRKEGLKIARGQYVLFIDSDDYVKKDLLITIANILSKSDFDIICFDYNTFPKRVRKAELSKYRAGDYDRAQIEKEIFPTLITGENGMRFPPSVWGKAFKRNLVLPIQNDLPDNIIIGEDSCVSYAAIYSAKSLYILHDFMYNYRVENASLTRGSKLFDWKEPLLRADFYLKYVSDNMFDQVARITAHSLFNVAISVLRNKKYCDAKKEIRKKLSQYEIQKYLMTAKFNGNIKEQFALHCLRKKKVFLMKLLSKVA